MEDEEEGSARGEGKKLSVDFCNRLLSMATKPVRHSLRLI